MKVKSEAAIHLRMPSSGNLPSETESIIEDLGEVEGEVRIKLGVHLHSNKKLHNVIHRPQGRDSRPLRRGLSSGWEVLGTRPSQAQLDRSQAESRPNLEACRVIVDRLQKARVVSQIISDIVRS